MNRLIALLFLSILATLPSACINISSFQTAEVLPPGKDRYHIGFSDYSGTNIKDRRRQIWPNVEIGYRRGLGDDWEWGSSLTLVGAIDSTIKRQLIRGNTFNLALGSGLSYVYYRAENADYYNLFSYTLPLYMSYRLNPHFVLYLNPLYASRWFVRERSSARSDWLGTSLGTLVYEKVAFEGSYLRSTRGHDSFQIGLAFFFD